MFNNLSSFISYEINDTFFFESSKFAEKKKENARNRICCKKKNKLQKIKIKQENYGKKKQIKRF